MLDFKGDAICLSGFSGTKLKCDVLGAYYPFWWNITSGGPSHNFGFHTVIVELFAGTGEVYIKDVNQTVLGSAGHALDLKSRRIPDSDSLKIVLVEESAECCDHLKKVIRRRWPQIPADRIQGPWAGNISKNVYLINKTLDEAIPVVRNLSGNSIYFFDPLRSVEWSVIEKVAHSRIKTFYQTGTEFIIFIFTSDWFLGRDEFVPLPTSHVEEKWTIGECRTVNEADELFGDLEWRQQLLTNESVKIREDALINRYKERLRKWFRYILPLPFNPKSQQLFHLIFCSNYEAGVHVTKRFYSDITNNQQFSPDNGTAFQRFKSKHPEVFTGITGRNRPLEWRVLWKIIVQHEDGLCDCLCSDLTELEGDAERIEDSLQWLLKKKYLKRHSVDHTWTPSFQQYILDWETVKASLDIDRPPVFEAISPDQIAKIYISADTGRE